VDDRIRVALAENVTEAQIMVATLEAEGIPAMTRSGSTWTVGVLLGSTGIGPIEIVVLREHAERAYELLHPEERPASDSLERG
jgi:hypothetical protein